MRLPQILTLFMLFLLFACNMGETDKKTTRPDTKPQQKLDDTEFQKLRKRQDSILELRQKKPRKKDRDSLKPVQA